MFKKVVAIASVTALLATATPAFAHGDRHDGGYRHGSSGSDNAGLIAFGALAGLAIGAAILSSQHNDAPPPVVYAPPPAPAYYAPPAPAYYAPPAPAYYAPPAPAYYAPQGYYYAPPGYAPAPAYYAQ
jgi:hypothetical protein